MSKVEADELKELDQLSDKLCHYHCQVFDDAFESLSVDSKYERLDKATVFLNSALSRISHFEAKERTRGKQAAYRGSQVRSGNAIIKEKRDSLAEHLKAFHVQICALYAPLLAGRPVMVDAGK